MIVVKLSKHWRVRRSEWLLAICTVALGVAYLTVPGLFASPWFTTMRAIGPQHLWGWTISVIGIARVVALFVNGAWRASPHLRCFGAMTSCALWMSLFVSNISSERVAQTVWVWFAFFFFDALNAIDAAGDARLTDIEAGARYGSPGGE